MRPDELFALETLAHVYGGRVEEGENPPDGYLVQTDRSIAVEVTRLIEHVPGERGAYSRKADDEPAHNLIEELIEEIGDCIPQAMYLLVILYTPLNNIRKTRVQLREVVLSMVEKNEDEKEAEIYSNRIVLSFYKGERDSGQKIVGVFPNKKSSSDIGKNTGFLLSKAITEKEVRRKSYEGGSEYWLVLLNEYWIAGDSSYQVAYESLKIEHDFEKVILINRRNRNIVHVLYEKITSH